MTNAHQRADGGVASWRAQSADAYGNGAGILPDEPVTASAGSRGEIERAVPAGQQLVDSFRRVVTIVRSSVPLRTIVFVTPPLVLPLSLGLSLGATLAVTLMLLWVAAAAAVLSTMMFDGGDQLALRAIERRLDQLANAPLPGDDEALMTIGAQLDAMSDRLDELGTSTAPPSTSSDMHHRPQEHWSSSQGGDHNDRYDHDVVAENPWSQPRWQR